MYAELIVIQAGRQSDSYYGPAPDSWRRQLRRQDQDTETSPGPGIPISISQIQTAETRSPLSPCPDMMWHTSQQFDLFSQSVTMAWHQQRQQGGKANLQRLSPCLTAPSVSDCRRRGALRPLPLTAAEQHVFRPAVSQTVTTALHLCRWQLQQGQHTAAAPHPRLPTLGANPQWLQSQVQVIQTCRQ